MSDINRDVGGNICHIMESGKSNEEASDDIIEMSRFFAEQYGLPVDKVLFLAKIHTSTFIAHQLHMMEHRDTMIN